MQRLKQRLRDLDITYRDLAKRAGQKTANVQCYFSEGKDLGPGPAWVEQVIREALRDTGVPADEINTLVGEWKQARLILNRGAEMAEAMTLEQQIGALVKSAWTLSIDVAADKHALKGMLRRGLGVDDETRRRGAQKLLDDELANEALVELQSELWVTREQALRDRKAAAEANQLDMAAKAAALEAAIAGSGDDALLVQCKELGVNPQDRLTALRKDAMPKAAAEVQEARQALEALPKQPLHPANPLANTPSALRFAQDSLDRAALVLSEPWTVAEEQPELALHIFALRRIIAPVPDLADDLRQKMDFARLPAGVKFWFYAGMYRAQPGEPARPAIWWEGKAPPQAQTFAEQAPGGLLFVGDAIPTPALGRAS